MYEQSWYANNVTASTAVTISLNAGSGFLINWAVAFEVSGQSTTTPIDRAGARANNALAPLADLVGHVLHGGSQRHGHRHRANERRLRHVLDPGRRVLDTARPSTAGAPLGVFYQFETSAGSVSPNYSLNPLDYAILSAFAFKGAGGAATCYARPLLLVE